MAKAKQPAQPAQPARYLLEPNPQILKEARAAAIQLAFTNLLKQVGVDDILDPNYEHIVVRSAMDLGRFALALKLLASEIAGPQGLEDFEYAFGQDRCHGGDRLDLALFSGVLRDELTAS